jgi:hypothetical protein
MSKWVKLTNLGSVLEADIMVERLRGAGLRARSNGGDVGMFGSGFQGPSVRGVDVLVLGTDLSAAREILSEINESSQE